MKTTIDIPDQLLAEVIEHSGKKTKRAAVLIALEEYLQRRRIQNIVEKYFGKCDGFFTPKQLERMRAAK